MPSDTHVSCVTPSRVGENAVVPLINTKTYQNSDHIAFNYSTHSTVVELFCFGLQSMFVPFHVRTEPTASYRQYVQSDRRLLPAEYILWILHYANERRVREL